MLASLQQPSGTTTGTQLGTDGIGGAEPLIRVDLLYLVKAIHEVGGKG
jgi:hypothetical protein